MEHVLKMLSDRSLKVFSKILLLLEISNSVNFKQSYLFPINFYIVVELTSKGWLAIFKTSNPFADDINSHILSNAFLVPK